MILSLLPCAWGVPFYFIVVFDCAVISPGLCLRRITLFPVSSLNEAAINILYTFIGNMRFLYKSLVSYFLVQVHKGGTA